MALVIDNCIKEDNVKNYNLITDCCCAISCTLSNNDNFLRSVSNLTIVSSIPSNFIVSNILIDGNPLSLPFDLDPFQTVTIDWTICASSSEVVDVVTLKVTDQTGVTNFNYNFESFAPSSFLSPTSLNFGNIAVGNGASLYINVPDTLLCCNDFYVSTLTAPFSEAGGVSVCPGDKAQQIAIFFNPTETGLATQDLTISINECNSIVIPLTGNGIEPPSGGTTPPQKNKVDQTTRVEACSPRTVNNRCNTARTLQSAIKTNAKRFGKR